MISFGSLSDMKYDQYDEIWIITNKLNTMPSARNVSWHPELGPSHELFGKVQQWKRDGEWDQKKFSSEYVDQFLRELKWNKTAVRSLMRLCKIGLTRNTLVVCYCSSDEMCHRSIIRGLIYGAYKARGLTQYIFGKDDANYYDRYRGII